MQDRLMVFVDGSNLLRATATKIQADISSDKPSVDAISLCVTIINSLVNRIKKEASFYDCKLIRRYWFGSVQGNEEYELNLRRDLRVNKLEPVIFRKRKGKEKRVDIAIAREMLINAFNGNYDLALLVAGDEDYVDLVNDLKKQIQNHEVTIDTFQKKISVSFIDRILFKTGKATITSEGEKILRKVGKTLKNVQDKKIRVVGHTDDRLIIPRFRYKFPSNWELSAARAARVIRFFQNEAGLDPTTMEAVGRSFYDPISSNDTAKGRALNRRVNIIIAPSFE